MFRIYKFLFSYCPVLKYRVSLNCKSISVHVCWKSQCYGPQLMRDVPALANAGQAMKLFSHPCLFLFVSFLFLSLSSSFLFPFTSSSSLAFLQLNTINYDLHLRIIQTLCLHLSRSTPLRKTLTVNHYLCIEYFLHLSSLNRQSTCMHRRNLIHSLNIH